MNSDASVILLMFAANPGVANVSLKRCFCYTTSLNFSLELFLGSDVGFSVKISAPAIVGILAITLLIF
jgi:hypothetical protein